jgi:hypothetical protein
MGTALDLALDWNLYARRHQQGVPMKVLVDAGVADPQAALALLSGDFDVTVLVVEEACSTPLAPLSQVATPVPNEALGHVARDVLHDAARRTVQALEQRARRLVPTASDVRVTCGAPARELVRAVQDGQFDVALVTPEHADVAKLLRRGSSRCVVLIVPDDKAARA